MPPDSRLAARVLTSCGCCWTDSCGEGRCSLRLPRQGIVATRSGSLYQTNHGYSLKLNDCSIFWSTEREDVVGIAELKGGRLRPAEVADQIQNGARLAEELAEGFDVKFLPLVVCNKLTTLDARALGARRILFRGRKYRIARVRCGGSLAALNQDLA